jgi:hypothetical protein
MILALACACFSMAASAQLASSFQQTEIYCEKKVTSDPTMPSRDCTVSFVTTVPTMLRNLSLIPTKQSSPAAPERHDTLCTAYFYVIPNGDRSGPTPMLGQFSWNQDDHRAIQFSLPFPMLLSAGTHELQLSMQAYGVASGGPDSMCSVYSRLFYTLP